MSLVSIIVPIYNVEQYLRKCIDSIINQTYKNLEILLVDDGSPDNCGQICDEYAKKDDRVKVIHKENGGLSSARNCGIEHATGKYIAFVDGDDFVSKNYISNLFTIIKKYNADISLTNKIYYFEKRQEKKATEYELSEEDLSMESTMLLENILKDTLPHETCGKLYKAEILKSNKYEKGLSVFEDFEYIIRILKKNPQYKIACDMGKYDYFYLQRDNSLSRGTYNECWNKELDFYIGLLKDDKFKKYSTYLKIWIAKKGVRNFKKIIALSDDEKVKKELKRNHNQLKYTQTKYYTSNIKGKIKFILIKNFPYLVNFFLSKKYKCVCCINSEKENI